MADNRDIIVRIKSDASDMLKGYERAISELEKYANKAQPFNEMQSDIDELRQGINELKTSIKSIGSDKIDSSQLDKLMQKLDSQAEKIRQLQKNQNKIKIEVDETSGKRLDNIISNAEIKLNQLNNALKPFKELGLSIDINDQSIDESNKKIQQYQKSINRLKQAQETINNQSNQFEGISEDDANKKMTDLISKYNELETIIKRLNSGESSKSVGKNLITATIELGETIKSINDLSLFSSEDIELPEIFGSQKNVKNQLSEITNYIDRQIQSSINSINKLRESVASVDVKNFTLKDGKISVPLQIDTTISQLQGQIKQLLTEVQGKIWSDNITVTIPLTFTSSYKGKVNEELKEIQNMVNNVTDDDLKNRLTLQVENLTKQLTQRDLRLEFKTNIEEINNNVHGSLSEITKALREAKLYLYPEIKVDDTSREEIQKSLNEISKSLKIDLSNKNFDFAKLMNQDEIKKIQDSFKEIDIKIVPKVELTDKDVENIIGKLQKQLSKLHIEIDTNKLQAGIRSALDNTIIDNWRNRFISTIDDVVAKIEKSFGRLGQNKFYEAMKGWNEADKIMRSTRVRQRGKTDEDYGKSAQGTLERKAYVNSKTGDISLSYIVDQVDHVSGEVKTALIKQIESQGKKLSELYDTTLHSHPANDMEIGRRRYKGIGSDLTFSSADLNSYSNEMKNRGIKKLMIESNGKINELDLSSVNETIVDKIVEEYTKNIKSQIKASKYLNGQNSTIDYTKRAEMANAYLSDLIKTYTKDDPSKYLKQYDIESLKIKPEDFTKEEQEINNLTKLLMEMSSTLSEINQKDIKFDTESLGTITTQINTLIQTLIELKQLFATFGEGNTFNISTEPIDRIITSIDKMTVSIQRAFGLATDEDISKQWSVVENKFKSIANETGKIDLRKQKEDIQELISEYQKYFDMGGQNTFDNLTDNNKTVDKLQKQYDKFNSDKAKEGLSGNELHKLNVDVNIDQAEIIKQINLIIDSINSNGGINKINIIPDTSSEDWKDFNKFIGNLSKIDSENINNFYTALNNIKESLSLINGLDNVTTIFKDININENQLNNLSKLPDVFNKIYESLNKISLTSDANSFLTQINNIVSQAEALKNLSSILKESKSKIKEVSKIVNESVDNSNVTNVNIVDNDNSNQQTNKQAEIINETGKISTQVTNEIIKSENKKQKEYGETTNALIALQKAQVGSAEAFKKSSNSFNGFDNEPNEQAKRFFETYAKNIANTPGLAESRYSINTDNQGNFKNATIKYYNEQLKQTVTETWAWHEANSKIAGDMSRMVVTNINYTDSISEREKAEERATYWLNKQEEKLKDIQALYDTSINPNTKKGIKNQEDLDVLRNKTEEITNIIKDNLGKNLSQEFKDNLVSMINDLERTRKSFTDKEYGATELSPKELSINKGIVGSQYDVLIAKTKTAGTYAEALTKEIIETKNSIDDIGDSAGLKIASDQLKAYRTEFQKLRAEYEGYNKNLKAINNYEKEASKLIELQAKQDFGNGEWGNQILSQTEKVNQAAEEAKKAFDIIESLYNNNKIDQEQYDYVSNLYNNAGQGSSSSQARYNDAEIAYQNKIQDALKKTKEQIDNLRKIDGTSIFQKSLNNASNAIDNLNNKLQSNDINLKEYQEEVKNIFNNLDNQSTIEVIKPSDIRSGMNEMKNLMNIISKGRVETKKLDEQNARLSFTFEEQRGKMRSVTLGYNQMTGAIDILNNTTNEVPTGLNKVFDSLSKKWRDVASYLASFGSLYTIWNAFQQGVTYVRELDTALTEMRKVSDETVDSLIEFQKASFDIADSVGSTAATIQNSTAEWMRLGESMEQAAESAQATNILLNVSEFEDINSATDALISMSQAYRDLDKMDIVDKANNIGM